MNPVCAIQVAYQGQALRVATRTLTCYLDYAEVNHEIKVVLFVKQQTQNPNLKTGAEILGLTWLLMTVSWIHAS
jgi:hypothetical protein